MNDDEIRDEIRDEVRIEKFDICALLDKSGVLAVKMMTADSRYIIQPFPIAECICITAAIWSFVPNPMMEALSALRSLPCMFFEDVVLALGGDFYQATVTEMDDNGDFKATLTILFPDDRIGTVSIEFHEALSLAMNRSIPVYVAEQALDRFERYLMELPRWYDMSSPVTRETLHATHPKRLAALPEPELKYLLGRFNELEDYESAALLHKALRHKEESQQQSQQSQQ
jgi:hypothetical protein